MSQQTLKESQIQGNNTNAINNNSINESILRSQLNQQEESKEFQSTAFDKAQELQSNLLLKSELQALKEDKDQSMHNKNCKSQQQQIEQSHVSQEQAQNSFNVSQSQNNQTSKEIEIIQSQIPINKDNQSALNDQQNDAKQLKGNAQEANQNSFQNSDGHQLMNNESNVNQLSQFQENDNKNIKDSTLLNGNDKLSTIGNNNDDDENNNNTVHQLQKDVDEEYKEDQFEDKQEGLNQDVDNINQQIQKEHTNFTFHEKSQSPPPLQGSSLSNQKNNQVNKKKKENKLNNQVNNENGESSSNINHKSRSKVRKISGNFNTKQTSSSAKPQGNSVNINNNISINNSGIKQNQEQEIINNDSIQSNRQKPKIIKKSLSPGKFPQDINEEHTEGKLFEALQRKKELQEKLMALDSEIGSLQNQVDTKKKDSQVVNHKKLVEITQDRDAQLKALELVKRMNQQRKELEQKKQKEREILNEILQNEIKETKDIEQLEKERLKEERRELIAKRMEEQKLKREERKAFEIRSKEMIKEISQASKTKSIEPPNNNNNNLIIPNDNKYYTNNVKNMGEMSELEKRKRELAMRRQMYRAPLQQDVNEDRTRSVPKSSFTYKILEEDKLLKEKQQKLAEEKKELFEKRKKYGQLVKDMYAPTINPFLAKKESTEDPGSSNATATNSANRQISPNVIRIKTSELSLNHKSSGKKSPNSPNYPLAAKTTHESSGLNSLNFQTDQNGIRFKKQIKNQQLMKISKKPRIEQVQQDEQDQQEEQNQIEKQQLPPPLPPKRQLNYLAELRKNREDQEKKLGKKTKAENWEKFQEDPNLSSNEKFNCILQSAARLEANAKRKEMKGEVSQNPETQEEINNLYIDSIKAKLALLDNLK